MLAQEIIRRKRDGLALERAHVDAFVKGLVDASWSDAQAAAMAMAIYVNGMSREETRALTDAMRASGDVLEWSGAGPVLDKHSTGGVGDKVSLALAPLVAACGGVIPMISGRGLGHTGGTLDKLESIPGYRVSVPAAHIAQALRDAGCAIVGATERIAPADRRLYAIRDVTATVESIPLICASILSKKLAAGLDAMALDIKVGNGAFARDLRFARELGTELMSVAQACGLRSAAWITDMNQVLGRTCGNALEVMEAVEYLAGNRADARLDLVTRTLAAELLVLGGVEPTRDAALSRVAQALASGAALERFARMVAALGGPRDFAEHAARHLPRAPVQLALAAPRAGWVARVATREIGIACVELGGGRRASGDAIDSRVGFSHVAAPGDRVERGDALAMVHAASETDARAACRSLETAFGLSDTPTQPLPCLVERIPHPTHEQQRTSAA